ncbi:ATP cone domain-containing protein [Flavobacterium sp.]|uniref:ATP cone domain-containing protein n=1 Tax=Flavobacterium sp. TaxID=239 RepID=UPI002489D622|nr:ATP cone domain-containing protein [Flavobacterium sp.]MDI1317494.1 ATP cone domain-containing protein [Flavobacterium sp.]
MEKYVIKRNGDYKPFERFKIKDAIEKSFSSASIPYDESVFESVLATFENKNTLAVEELQDRIEKVLF